MLREIRSQSSKHLVSIVRRVQETQHEAIQCWWTLAEEELAIEDPGRPRKSSELYGWLPGPDSN